MTRKPTVNSDSVAQDLIRSYFERWQRLEQEKTAIGDDLRELFAEAKGMGFDTKVLRKLYRDKVGDHAERMEFEALYDLYAAALGMVDATGARPARADEEEQDSEPDADPKQVNAAVPAGEGVRAVATAPSATHRPETANQSQGDGTVEDLDPPVASVTSLAGVEGDEDRHLTSPSAPDKTGEATASPAPTNIVKLGSGKPLRPYCQHLDDLTKCGGYGKVHCHGCLQAHAEKQGLTA